MKRVVLVLSIASLGAVAVIHKLFAEIPPDWFVKKFEVSFLGSIPFGIEFSFLIIILLEILAPLLLLLGLFSGELKRGFRWIPFGFLLYYLLFAVLTFGSFLVEDYSNGFKDFIYLAAIAFLDKTFFREPLNS